MTQDEIIEMARQSGFSEWAIQTPSDLIGFATLVAAKEREACAKVCEEMKEEHGKHACAYAIRNRGEA
jgi:hypothetical protein